ncbi:hypothetical protein BT69DRAFT_1275457, partial [Atractiella rhizophila]
RLSWETDIEDETCRFYTIPTSPISFRPSSLLRTSLTLYYTARHFAMIHLSSGTFPVFFPLTHHRISAGG